MGFVRGSLRHPDRRSGRLPGETKTVAWQRHRMAGGRCRAAISVHLSCSHRPRLGISGHTSVPLPCTEFYSDNSGTGPTCSGACSSQASQQFVTPTSRACGTYSRWLSWQPAGGDAPYLAQRSKATSRAQAPHGSRAEPWIVPRPPRSPAITYQHSGHLHVLAALYSA